MQSVKANLTYIGRKTPKTFVTMAESSSIAYAHQIPSSFRQLSLENRGEVRPGGLKSDEVTTRGISLAIKVTQFLSQL